MGEALALLSLLFFSSNTLLVSVITRRLKQDLGFLIGLGGNLIFSGLLLVVRGARSPSSGSEWHAVLLFALGGLGTAYLGRRLFFSSVQKIGPSRASSLLITNPVFAGIISWVALGERLAVSAVVAVALVVTGLYLSTRVPATAVGTAGRGTSLMSDRRRGPPTAAPKTFAALPGREVGLALAGALAFGAGNVLRSVGVREWNQPVLGAFVGASAGTVAYLLLHTHLPTLVDRIRSADRLGVWLWLLSGFLTISAQSALIASTRYLPVAVAVLVSTALPIVVIPASLLFLRNREAVTVRTAVGGLLTLAGVAALLLG